MTDPEPTLIDAIVLTHGDTVAAERTLGALSAASLDVPLRPWLVVARGADHVARALRGRCVWAQVVTEGANETERVERAVSAGRSDCVLLLQAGEAPSPAAVLALHDHLAAHPELESVGLDELPEHAAEVRSRPPVLSRRAGRSTDAPAAGSAEHRTGPRELWLTAAPRQELRLVQPRLAADLKVERRLHRERHRPSVPYLDRSPETLGGELVRRVRRALESAL